MLDSHQMFMDHTHYKILRDVEQQGNSNIDWTLHAVTVPVTKKGIGLGLKVLLSYLLNYRFDRDTWSSELLNLQCTRNGALGA